MKEIVNNAEAAEVAQRFAVEFGYPVIFTRGVFDPENRLLVDAFAGRDPNDIHRAMVFVDSGVLNVFRGLPSEIERYFQRYAGTVELVCSPIAVPGGEAAKADLRLVEDWVRKAFEHRMCRHSYFLVIGGGAVLDAVGFAGALVHRGLRLIRIPTTVLAQNDAGIGVKNGINAGLGKNALGVFAPPHAVINDFDFLSGLPDADWAGGIAEAFKVAILKDGEFFQFLREAADNLRARREGPMERLIVRCAELHLEHIRSAGDPFEMGAARPLDFGHWSAHALEILSGYRIHHGQAVAMGLAIDCAYAREMGWLGSEDFEKIHEALRRCGFPLWYPELNDVDSHGKRKIFRGLEDFREHLGGRLTLTFPDGIGKRREEHEAIEEVFERVFKELEARHQQGEEK